MQFRRDTCPYQHNDPNKKGKLDEEEELPKNWEEGMQKTLHSLKHTMEYVVRELKNLKQNQMK